LFPSLITYTPVPCSLFADDVLNVPIYWSYTFYAVPIGVIYLYHVNGFLGCQL